MDPSCSRIAAASNNVRRNTKGMLSLPLGIAAALSGNMRATLQVVTSDASCFSATLTSVKIADGVRFKATLP